MELCKTGNFWGEKRRFQCTTSNTITTSFYIFGLYEKNQRHSTKKNLTDTDQSRFRIVSQISWGVTIADKRFKNANTVL